MFHYWWPFGYNFQGNLEAMAVKYPQRKLSTTVCVQNLKIVGNTKGKEALFKWNYSKKIKTN